MLLQKQDFKSKTRRADSNMEGICKWNGGGGECGYSLSVQTAV